MRTVFFFDRQTKATEGGSSLRSRSYSRVPFYSQRSVELEQPRIKTRPLLNSRLARKNTVRFASRLSPT